MSMMSDGKMIPTKSVTSPATSSTVPSSSSSSLLLSSPLTVNPVKSTAVVKYSAVQSPATFAQLQCNTNLNLPPSNWLSSSAESYGLQSVWSHNTGFTSFRMAHMFPDCVGEVDVVSDAKNIKKLLKMPYSHEVVSMMVHRIENTLLLDDFDIQKYLLRQAESDWEWLKEFFYQHIFHRNDDSDKEKRLFSKTNSRNTLQQKNLVSKFLYHSLVVADNQIKKNENPPLQLNELEPKLPEPTNEEKLPDPNYNHNFARNVVWTFENIQMLIGTDMPIFGGKTHPCISLRLRDMKKPINVLTGIDYWLDNLMCNVPEVVMCYHLDGIVKKYELIKTEDLPNLNDAKFNPKVIRDVAQNILSFLKTNATKAGHTYWLFKGKDDDVVKLYDLTSLCSEISDDKGQNPFTVPVAMLLYRVARNMKYSHDNRGNHGTIRMLLKNCVQLLNCEKYPQIVTSAHYMLSDLYVPADTDPSSPILVNQSDDDTDSTSGSGTNNYENSNINLINDETYSVSATIMSLALAQIKDESEPEESKYKPPPISGTIAERCRAALDHVSHGLKCLKFFPIDNEVNEEKKKSESTSNEEGVKCNVKNCKSENLKTARPFEAIPMPYASLDQLKNSDNCNDANVSPSKRRGKKKTKKEKAMKENNNGYKEALDTAPKALLCKSKNDTLPTWQAPKTSDNSSWESHLKTLLYEKASLIFAVLVEYEFTNQRYGGSLRHILAVLKCQKILEIFCQMKNNKLISYLLGRAGDCCLMTVQDWRNIDMHREAYYGENEDTQKIIDEILGMEYLDLSDIGLLPGTLENLEATLVASLKYYEEALALEPLENDKNNLLRRLGNIHNELGVLYMNQAATKYHQDETTEFTGTSLADVTHLLTDSLSHLEAGVKSFETVRDEANLALLHSNTGRLMRLCAHMNTKKRTQERNFYNKALASYQKALQVLGNKKTNPTIWDTVTWDLSTTLYTMATLLQDFPTSGNKTEEELEREVVDLFQKALKYCDTETPGSRQPVYQFRAATIQHRLGSLYHHAYRKLDPVNEHTKRKTNLQLSKLYYEKAAKIFMTLEQSIEFLTVQLERVALSEHQAQTSKKFNGKLKAYQNGIELILQCQPMLKILAEKHKSGKQRDKDASESVIENKTVDDCDKRGDDEENKLVSLLEQRFQYILKSVTKLCISKTNTGNTKNEFEDIAKVYKMAYSRTLRNENNPGCDSLEHIILLLEELIPKLRHITINN